MAALKLTTVANVKLAAWPRFEDADRDTEIDYWIQQVSDQVARHLDRETLIAAQTEYHDAEETTRTLYLRAWPIDTGQSFSLRYSQSQDWDNEAEIDSSLYYLDARRGRVRFVEPGLFLPFPAAFRGVYTGGMSDSAANFIGSYPDIAGAVDIQVMRIINILPNIGKTTISLDSSSQTTFAQSVRLDKDVIERLAPHRRAVL